MFRAIPYALVWRGISVDWKILIASGEDLFHPILKLLSQEGRGGNGIINSSIRGSEFPIHCSALVAVQ